MWVEAGIIVLCLASLFSVWEFVAWVINVNEKIGKLEQEVVTLNEFKTQQSKDNKQAMENFKDVDKQFVLTNKQIDSISTEHQRKLRDVASETRKIKHRSMLPVEYQEKIQRKHAAKKQVKKITRKKTNE
jgi:hypothetical protein